MWSVLLIFNCARLLFFPFMSPGLIWNMSSAVLAGTLPLEPLKWWHLLPGWGHGKRGLNVPWRRERPARHCDFGFTLLELLSFSFSFSPKWPWPILSQFLTYKSISGKLPGHHASDVPLVISLGLIADLEKWKKGKEEKVGSGALEVEPSHHQHTEHILCFGLIQLDIHWSFSCFQASLINFVVNNRTSSCYSFLSCVRWRTLGPSPLHFIMLYGESSPRLKLKNDKPVHLHNQECHPEPPC